MPPTTAEPLTLPTWLEVGMPVVRTRVFEAGAQPPERDELTVERVTKTLVVLDDGTRLKRSSLFSSRDRSVKVGTFGRHGFFGEMLSPRDGQDGRTERLLHALHIMESRSERFHNLARGNRSRGQDFDLAATMAGIRELRDLAEQVLRDYDTLDDASTATVEHLFAGSCPGPIDGLDARDPSCPACTALGEPT